MKDVSLRNYQKEAISHIARFYEKGEALVALIMPFGSGVFLTVQEILEKIAKPNDSILFVSETCRIGAAATASICRSQSSFRVNAITAEKAVHNLQMYSRIDLQNQPDIIVFININFDRSRRILLNLQAGQKALYIGEKLPGVFACDFSYYEVPSETVWSSFHKPVISFTLANDLYYLPANAKKDQLIEKQKNQLLKAKKALRDKNKEIQDKNRTIQMLQEQIKNAERVLACVGFQQGSLKELNDLIVASLSDPNVPYFSSDEERILYFEQKRSTIITDFVKTKKILQPDIVKAYKKRCCDFLGDVLFEKRFCEETRSDLLTALFTYETMEDSPASEYFDYAGVCLLLSRSLEREVLTVARNQYLAYLVSRHPHDFFQTNDLPQAIRENRGKNGAKLEEWYERKCTLGSLCHLIGYSEEPKVSIPDCDFDQFKVFAKTQLYPETTPDKEIEERLRSIVEETNQVAKDYRNESAHVGYFTITKAQECFDFILEVEKIMLKIFGPMTLPKEDFHDRPYSAFFQKLVSPAK